MKYIFCCLIFYTFIITSCKVQNSSNKNLDGQSYTHTYLYSSMGNEYGKGGGKKFFKLLFDKENMQFLHISQSSLPDKDGKQVIKRDTIDFFTTSYKINDELITIDNTILPQLEIKNDTLIAPQININNIPPSVLKDVIFKYIDKDQD